GQRNLFISDSAPCRKRLAGAIINYHAALLSNAVHRQKADIVGRKLVFDTRVSQPNDQLHRPYFFSVSFAAGSPSSSVSCLPFLMTSGSAGPAAAASAAASGVGATSSLTDVMCDTAWSSSVMNFSLPP